MLVVELALPGMEKVTATSDALFWSWTHAVLFIDELIKREGAAVAAGSTPAASVSNLLKSVPKVMQTFLRLATVVTVHSVEKVRISEA
jgi:hypothetical protein